MSSSLASPSPLPPQGCLKTPPAIRSNEITVNWCEPHGVQVHHITIQAVLVLPVQEARITWTEDLGAAMVPMEAPFLIFLQWYLIDYFYFFLLHSSGHRFYPFYIEIYPKPETITLPEPQNERGLSKMNVWANTELMGSFNMCTGTFKFCLHSTCLRNTAEAF